MNEYTGTIRVGGQIHNANALNIQPGYVAIKFRIFDSVNGAATHLELGDCKYGNAGQIQANGAASIRGSGNSIHELIIPIKAVPNAWWKWNAMSCAISYRVTRDVPPEVRLLDTRFVRDDGVPPTSYMSYGWVRAGGPAGNQTTLSSAGGYEGEQNITGVKGNGPVPIVGFDVKNIVPAAQLDVQYARSVTLNNEQSGATANVIRVEGAGSAKAVWHSSKGGASELTMKSTTKNAEWGQGEELSLSAGEIIEMGVIPAAWRAWGTRSEEVTVTWEIQ